MERTERIGRLLDSGFNCAESMAVVFAEEIGMPIETAIQTATAFGAGLGRTGNVCGLVSGAAIVLGWACGRIDPADEATKERAYAGIAELIREVEARKGSILCTTILGADLSDPASRKRVQEDGSFRRRCYMAAVEIAELVERHLQKLTAES